MIKDISGDYLKFREGWKIHLAVRPENHELVNNWLLTNCKYGYKYGKAAGQTGKDFTIYVGSWDETEAFAARVTQEIGNLLEKVTGDAALDDLHITPKTAARYDTRTPGFHQYGAKGIPFLMDDVAQKIWNKAFNEREAMERAYGILAARHGTYFTGTNNRVRQLLGL